MIYYRTSCESNQACAPGVWFPGDLLFYTTATIILLSFCGTQFEAKGMALICVSQKFIKKIRRNEMNVNNERTKWTLFLSGAMTMLLLLMVGRMIIQGSVPNNTYPLTPTAEVSVPLTPFPRLGYIEGQPKKIMLSLRPGETAVPAFRIVSVRANQFAVYGQPPCEKTEWMTQSGGTVEGRISEILISAFKDAKIGARCHWFQAIAFISMNPDGTTKETERYFIEIEMKIN